MKSAKALTRYGFERTEGQTKPKQYPSDYDVGLNESCIKSNRVQHMILSDCMLIYICKLFLPIYFIWIANKNFFD